MTKKETIEVIPFGTEVMIADKIEGKVRAVTIGPNNTVFYQVAYWNGNSLVSEDFHESEISSSSKTVTQIGFNR